mmetsp:Transcript_19642/g.29525  ORF Transcript_19642/g.29525 Transcript_19642/m.29525 type:complete len:131 (+) Transcript_19642:1110-1502(+)
MPAMASPMAPDTTCVESVGKVTSAKLATPSSTVTEAKAKYKTMKKAKPAPQVLSLAVMLFSGLLSRNKNRRGVDFQPKKEEEEEEEDDDDVLVLSGGGGCDNDGCFNGVGKERLLLLLEAFRFAVGLGMA